MAKRIVRRWDEERTELLGQRELFVQEGKGGEYYYYAWLQEPEVETCPLCSGKAIKMQDLFSKTYQELIRKDDGSAVVTLEYGFHKFRCLNNECRHVFAKEIHFASRNCPHETPEYSNDGSYYVIRTADQDPGYLRPDENMYRLDENEYIKRIRRLPLAKDDIVYGREGERWGLACIVPASNKYCLGQRMMQFRCNTSIFLPEFARWALNSYGVYMQGTVDTIGSTSPHVNISTMRDYQIPIPSIVEQERIAKYITERCDKIINLIAEKELLITDLETYKKALIFEVVTGKRRVC